ncbi:hypothetical protein IT570_01290 [Candidatus Sumerlaeota bacterium]|nr:hypothetical protein [Candidatus Sumerlaeota bacterium]
MSNTILTEWRSLLVQHVLRKTRRFYLYVVGYQILLLALHHSLMALGMRFGTPSVTRYQVLISLSVGLTFLAWCIQVGAAFFYARWAYHETRRGNEALRLAHLNFREGIAALVLPIVLLWGILVATYLIIIIPLAFVNILLFHVDNLSAPGLFTALIQIVVSDVKMVCSYSTQLMLAVTIVLRRAVQIEQGTPFLPSVDQFIVRVGLLLVIQTFLWMYFLGITFFFLGNQILVGVDVALQLLALLVCGGVFSLVWIRDLRVARQLLFRPADSA